MLWQGALVRPAKSGHAYKQKTVRDPWNVFVPCVVHSEFGRVGEAIIHPNDVSHERLSAHQS